jgi:predicted nucleic acid-binding Zn ribbon protein
MYCRNVKPSEADYAAICAKCGRPLSKQRQADQNTKILVAVILIVLLICIIGFFSSSSERSSGSGDSEKNLALRRDFKATLQRNYSKAGLNYDISLTGADERGLRMYSPKIDKATIDAITSQAKVLSEMKDSGFTEIVFSNGVKTWTFNMQSGLLQVKD